MLFNSLEFLYLFLPVTAGLFYLASHFRLLRLSKHILLWASFCFYAYWKVSYFLLILFKIITNYFLAVAIGKGGGKRWLWLGAVFNLGILCYFKYWGFLTLQTAAVVSIPLGISFYTFTQMAYLEDLHQKKTRFKGLMPYSLFVIFFPHLIAGPIVHYSQIMPQLDRVRTYVATYRNLFAGIFFFLIGLFQKVVIADSLGPMADTGFANAPLLNLLEAWAALLAYAAQIYFDFAGYSNMAIGLALLFNVRFPVNFNSPYQAVSLIDFWRRWHMTLSFFLRDYLYFRLGGNRLGHLRQYANIFFTMLIGGLWHGAGWTFILWGGYHGLLLVLNHFWENRGFKIPRRVGQAVTFFLVVYGWVFFRSPDLSSALEMTRGLFGWHGFQWTGNYFIAKRQMLLLILPLFIIFVFPNAEYWARRMRPSRRWGFVFCALFMAGILCLNSESAFLYFQF